MRFQCDQCEYAATTSGNLRKHMEAKHEGIRYPCDQCEHAASTASHLRRHKKSRHGGIREGHLCDQCGYSAASVASLKTHKEYLSTTVSDNLVNSANMLLLRLVPVIILSTCT